MASYGVFKKVPGFKSVFNVAQVVHVSSARYNFKFDDQGGLTSLIPEKEDKQPHMKAGWTCFDLELSRISPKKVVTELQNRTYLAPRRSNEDVQSVIGV